MKKGEEEKDYPSHGDSLACKIELALEEGLVLIRVKGYGNRGIGQNGGVLGRSRGRFGMIVDLDKDDVRGGGRSSLGGGGRRGRRGCGSFLEKALEGPLGGAAAHLGGLIGGGDGDRRRWPEVIGDFID